MPVNKLVIISYSNFLSLNEKSRQALSQCDDFLVSINKDDYASLSREEKNKLIGVALTDEKHNAKIIEQQNLKQEIEPKEILFKGLPQIVESKKLAQTFYEKHRKKSHPYAPRKIYNYNFNTKKKGGR